MRYYVEFYSSISRLGIVPSEFGSALGLTKTLRRPRRTPLRAAKLRINLQK